MILYIDSKQFRCSVFTFVQYINENSSYLNINEFAFIALLTSMASHEWVLEVVQGKVFSVVSSTLVIFQTHAGNSPTL